MITLAEIEQAADALSTREVKALLEHLEARLKAEEAGARSKAAGNLVETLQQLSRPMEGKSWSTRDELHER